MKQRMKNMKQRNGEAELLRFLFALGIAAGHYSINLGLNIFNRVEIGVEFFFLLSGLLMAKSADRCPRGGDIGNETWQFIKRKIKVFYPYYISAIVFQLILVRFVLQKWSLSQILTAFLEGIPQYLLIQMSGMDDVSGAVGISGRWYLSVMILGLTILYPILLRYRQTAVKVLFPLIGFFGLGFLQENYGTIIRVFDFNQLCSNALIRGLAEISIGASCFEISCWLSKINLTFPGKIIAIIAKLSCFVIVFLYLAEVIYIAPLAVFFLIAFGIILIFSEVGTSILSNNKLCMFLGRVSLPLYIIHVPILYTLMETVGNSFIEENFYCILALVIILAIIFMYFVDWLIKFICQIKHIFIC